MISKEQFAEFENEVTEEFLSKFGEVLGLSMKDFKYKQNYIPCKGIPCNVLYSINWNGKSKLREFSCIGLWIETWKPHALDSPNPEALVLSYVVKIMAGTRSDLDEAAWKDYLKRNANRAIFEWDVDCSKQPYCVFLEKASCGDSPSVIFGNNEFSGKSDWCVWVTVYVKLEGSECKNIEEAIGPLLSRVKSPEFMRTIAAVRDGLLPPEKNTLKERLKPWVQGFVAEFHYWAIRGGSQELEWEGSPYDFLQRESVKRIEVKSTFNSEMSSALFTRNEVKIAIDNDQHVVAVVKLNFQEFDELLDLIVRIVLDREVEESFACSDIWLNKLLGLTLGLIGQDGARRLRSRAAEIYEKLENFDAEILSESDWFEEFRNNGTALDLFVSRMGSKSSIELVSPVNRER